MVNAPDDQEACSADLARMRAEYRQTELRREDLKENPIEQFTIWWGLLSCGDKFNRNAPHRTEKISG